MNSDLIIDVGMHTGKDTEFYLRKGFKVVAIEADPYLVAQVEQRLHSFIEQGLLKIYNVAINSYDGSVDFYRNLQKDDWGTISRDFAARNQKLGTTTTTIKVNCLRFERILEECGIPYYLKIDIEGADTLCLQALLKFPVKPKFLSIESGLNAFAETFTELSCLWVLGYRQFKIVNQMRNPEYVCPTPPREGNYAPTKFDWHMSGPFGEEAPGRWLSIEETFDRYRSILREQSLWGASGKFYGTPLKRLNDIYRRLRGKEPVGWYDFHAKLGPA